MEHEFIAGERSSHVFSVRWSTRMTVEDAEVAAVELERPATRLAAAVRQEPRVERRVRALPAEALVARRNLGLRDLNAAFRTKRTIVHIVTRFAITIT